MDNRIHWFFDSLARELDNDFTDKLMVVVDFFEDEAGRREEIAAKAPPGLRLIHVPPKPTVWQGQYRLTSRNYFAPANARNTSTCLAPDGWIFYIDDLSVLLPGWYNRVRSNMIDGRVTVGSYSKVTDLEVVDGVVVSYTDFPPGRDSRWPSGSDVVPLRLGGGALFGGSVLAPIEAILAVNGWDEACDSMGFEDCICGIMLEYSGWPVYYDRTMRHLECEEAGFAEQDEWPFPRVTKKINKPGVNPERPGADHVLLDTIIIERRNRASNEHLGPDGIRGLREKILAGEPFPITQTPEIDWRDGQPISEM